MVNVEEAPLLSGERYITVLPSITDETISMPVDDTKAELLKPAGTDEGALNTMLSVAGSKPVIVAFPSRPITEPLSNETSYTKTSAPSVAATDLLFSCSLSSVEPPEPESPPVLPPELEPPPLSGVGLTAPPPPPPPPQAARTNGHVIAENKLTSLFSLLEGVNIFL